MATKTKSLHELRGAGRARPAAVTVDVTTSADMEAIQTAVDDLLDHIQRDEAGVAGVWRATADAFYERLVAKHYDFAARTVDALVQAHVAAVSGKPYRRSQQDRIGLAGVIRVFAGRRKVSGQFINRLATLGAAGAHWKKAPSACIDDPGIGKGSINMLMRKFRPIANPPDPEREARQMEAEQKRMASAIDALTASDSGIGRQLAGDNILLRFGAGSAAGRKLQADRLSITDDEPHIIQVKREKDMLRVIWCDVGEEVPSPEQDRKAQDEAGKEEDRERGDS